MSSMLVGPPRLSSADLAIVTSEDFDVRKSSVVGCIEMENGHVIVLFCEREKGEVVIREQEYEAFCNGFSLTFGERLAVRRYFDSLPSYRSVAA